MVKKVVRPARISVRNFASLSSFSCEEDVIIKFDLPWMGKSYMAWAFEAKNSPESRFRNSIAEVLKGIFNSFHCAGWQVWDWERCLELTQTVINKGKQKDGVLIHFWAYLWFCNLYLSVSVRQCIRWNSPAIQSLTWIKKSAISIPSNSGVPVIWLLLDDRYKNPCMHWHI